MKFNGLDRGAFEAFLKAMTESPETASLGIDVVTRWRGGTRADNHVSTRRSDGEFLSRKTVISVDEPTQLMGDDSAPNPQELFLAGLNSCLLAVYVFSCTAAGLEIESLEISTTVELDLRGAFGLDPDTRPGYECLDYKVRVRGSGTPAEFRRVHQWVTATSPNFWNLANPIQLNGRLVVEEAAVDTDPRTIGRLP